MYEESKGSAIEMDLEEAQKIMDMQDTENVSKKDFVEQFLNLVEKNEKGKGGSPYLQGKIKAAGLKIVQHKNWEIENELMDEWKEKIEKNDEEE